MITGIGIDIVAVERVQRMIERRGERALKRLFTETERAYCERMPNAFLHYAARFAAKEAFVKAIGVGFSAGVTWLDAGVVNDARGKPELVLQGRGAEIADSQGVRRRHVSLSHDPTHAAAVVVLERSGDET